MVTRDVTRNLIAGVGGTGVDNLCGGLGDLADKTTGHQFLDRLSCERAANLQSLNESGDGDKLHLGDLRQEAIIYFLVEKDQVVGLLAGFALRPLLFLGLATTCGRKGLCLL